MEETYQNKVYQNINSNHMKTTLSIFILVLLTTFFSCGQPTEKKNVTVDTTDKLQTKSDKEENERLEKRKKIEEQEKADSIRLDNILQNALKIANQNFDKNRFSDKYEVSTDYIPVNVEINLDYYFTKARPHLIIRRDDIEGAIGITYIDIYSKGDNNFEKVVSHKQWYMEYRNDTIRDINGDGLNDFVVNGYGVNGCCLKAFSIVYLLRQDKKSFSKNYDFINPTFSPKEKIIRGLCYGYPGETTMYKYKWNGEKVDTLEYISYEKNEKGVKTGKVIISTDEPYGDNYKILKIVNSVPTEYRKIEDYDWFTGDGYE